MTTPGSRESDSEDDDEGAHGGMEDLYVFIRLFLMMPLSSLWNKHHIDSPFLTVHEGPEIPSSGSERRSDASGLSLTLPPLVAAHSTDPLLWAGFPPATGETIVGRKHHRPVTVGTRHAADAMIAGRHLHLALAETTVESRYGRNRRSSPVAPRQAVSSTQRLGLEDAAS